MVTSSPPCHRRACRCCSLRRAPPNATSKSPASSIEPAADESGKARTTSRPPCGNWSIRWPTTARSLRLTLFRVTAFPTAFETTKPTTAGPLPAVSAARWTTTEFRLDRTPRRTAHSKSSGRRIRCAPGSTARRQAESSARPLRRRPARIARPARVRMRSRNPWVFARRRLFGWNVRLVTIISNYFGESHRPGTSGAGLLLMSTSRCTPLACWAVRARFRHRRQRLPHITLAPIGRSTGLVATGWSQGCGGRPATCSLSTTSCGKVCGPVSR